MVCRAPLLLLLQAELESERLPSWSSSVGCVLSLLECVSMY